MKDKVEQAMMSRRRFLKLSSATALTAVLAACGAGGGASNGRSVKIGYVFPETGPLASFGEAGRYVVEQMTELFSEGITVGDATLPLEILTKDSQSDPNRAAEVAADLILQDQVDLMLVTSTPDTTVPVAEQCEINGMPLISTDTPWQPWYFRNPNIGPEGYQWTFHFFWGLEDIIQVFSNMWGDVETNQTVGVLWPNDPDGLAWADPVNGFPPALEAAGYNVIDPGRYENLKDDFSAEISAFKEAGVEIVSGVMIPPDLVTFMTQASQQGFNPKVVTVGKAALFPAQIEAISGGLGDGISSELWWTPTHPFSSSLTNQTAAELADEWTEKTDKQWTQPLGFVHALFEVAADVLSRTSDLDDKQAIVDAIKATNINTVVGPVNWSTGPTPNISKTPLVGGQWGVGEEYPFEIEVISNDTAPNIPQADEIEPIS